MYPYYGYFGDFWLITCCTAVLLCCVSQLAKCCTKRCLKFEKNAVGHTTFQWRPTCWLGFYCVYMCMSLSGFWTICPDLVLLTSFTCAGSFFAHSLLFLSPEYLLSFYDIVLCSPLFGHFWCHFVPHIDHMCCLWLSPIQWHIMLDYY